MDKAAADLSSKCSQVQYPSSLLSSPSILSIFSWIMLILASTWTSYQSRLLTIQTKQANASTGHFCFQTWRFQSSTPRII